MGNIAKFDHMAQDSCEGEENTVFLEKGPVLNFDQSEARKHCFLTADFLKFRTLPENTVLYQSCISRQNRENGACGLSGPKLFQYLLIFGKNVQRTNLRKLPVFYILTF